MRRLVFVRRYSLKVTRASSLSLGLVRTIVQVSSVFARRIYVSFRENLGSLWTGYSFERFVRFRSRSNSERNEDGHSDKFCISRFWYREERFRRSTAGSSSRLVSKSSRNFVRLMRSPKQSFTCSRGSEFGGRLANRVTDPLCFSLETSELTAGLCSCYSSRSTQTVGFEAVASL